jgi:hypothetical protein
VAPPLQPDSVLLAYVPFMQPLPAWDYWYLLAIPLCAAVSIVYKSIRCRSMRTVPREAAKATGWILVGLVAAAVALTLVVKVFEWAAARR